MGVFNAFIAYKFIKILTTPWKESDAYILGIIDEKGKILKKRRKLETTSERKSYTIFHQLIWNLKKILEKVPIFRSKLGSFAAALYLIKEHSDPTGTLMLLFIGFGYAKPVPVNPYKLKNPNIDIIKVAAA